MVRLGVPDAGLTVTVSLPVPGVEPPPEMLTVFVIVAGAFVATAAVTVIAG